MKSVLTLSFCLLSLSACNATYNEPGTQVHVNDGYYHDDYHGAGNFCPPGQAKKGNC